MGDLSENFSRHEFGCRCGCGFDTVDAELLVLLQQARDHFKASIRIVSGCRCAAHNTKVGGAAGSQHLYGRAADIACAGASPAELYAFFASRYPDRYGLGRYATWAHIDSRSGGPARWQG